MLNSREPIHTAQVVEDIALRRRDVSVRVLGKADLPGYLAHLLRLSRQCRRSRFGNEVKDKFLHDYVSRVDLANTLVLGYFEAGELRGAAELRSLQNEWCGEAEVAFSVEEACRSKGIGNRLMACIVVEAEQVGVAQVHLICDRQNRAMQCIAEKAGCKMRFEDSDCICTMRVESRREDILRTAA